MPRSKSLTDRELTLAASASSSWVSLASARSCRSNPPNSSAGCSVMIPPILPQALTRSTANQHGQKGNLHKRLAGRLTCAISATQSQWREVTRPSGGGIRPHWATARIRA
jgi:hypothetical protein